ncbi:MAG TPA: GTP-binding protein [Candidatus Limivivens merdigallinarum]|uniref:GTP-binding protein n=1 Tax=Candidatus Limivivens merdigallinarum TaxID=2840859 RepID=A0A9D0ZXL9_9FIRM|nr:GTP-binding protein [Candidatus Limivivens merdigallinarum]
MKILIVSGFLGAGKTTFIKRMLDVTGKDLVVMENEYGEVGIDGELLNQGEKVNIWELTEGCICCTMKSDFASSILTIAGTLDPEYLIVEPTGVGMLSNVIANIRQIEYERISLLSPVTIVDGNTFGQCRREYGEIFEDQVKTAGTVVVSKRGFESKEEAGRLYGEIKKINPSAKIQVEPYEKLPPSWWLEFLNTDFSGSQISETKEEQNLDSVSLSGIALPSGNHVIAFLEELIQGKFGRIYRAKGFLDVGTCFLRFDVVGDRYTVTGFPDTEIPRSVFIGKDLQKNRLRRRLLQNFHVDVKALKWKNKK